MKIKNRKCVTMSEIKTTKKGNRRVRIIMLGDDQTDMEYLH